MRQRADVPLLRPLGLTIGWRHGWRSAAIATGAGAGFGLWMAVADATLFRRVVPEVQHRLLAEWSLADRFARFIPGAIRDELLLRLVGITALVWVGRRLTGLPPHRLHRPAAILAAAVLWPLLSLGYLVPLQWSGLTFAREACLHVGAGVLWGWLYCRHGWLAGVTGHCAAHLALQPLLTVLG